MVSATNSARAPLQQAPERDPGHEPPLPGAEETMAVLSRGVQDVLRAAPHPPTRVSLSYGDASVEVEWAAPAEGARPPGPQAAAAAPAAVPSVEHVGVELRAPLLGTYYAAPEPHAAPFVAVGDVVEAGQQVAIIEAMKLMNTVLAEAPGEIVEILVADGQPVEYGQPLMVLRAVEAR